MQALKDVLEGGAATVPWSAVQAALQEQLQAPRERLREAEVGDTDDAASGSPAPPSPRSGAGDLQEEPRLLLDSAPLWRQFFSVTNEMIVTKAGRRMFPVLKLHVSQLEPTAMYTMVLEFRCTNQHRWRFLNGNWQKGSSCEDNAELRHVFVHFSSVAPGSQWMQEPVSFAKLKLSNRENGASKIKLNSLHKYQPYAHLIKMTASGRHHPLHISTFTFPETQFIAVTAYQNDKVTQMKIRNNPFAKAFLGGNSSERAHSSSYMPPLEMQHTLITRLHPPLLPLTPPHTLAALSPPPYPSPFQQQLPSQSFFQEVPVGGVQGGNYPLAPQIQQQMTPPVMSHDQFVYHDYIGPIDVYDEPPIAIDCYQPQASYLYDNSAYCAAGVSPDYLPKPTPSFSLDDETGHTPLPTTPSTASSTSRSPPASEDQQCFYLPFHHTL